MKPATLSLALFVVFVQAGIPTPSIMLPSGVPSLTKTSSGITPSSSSQIPKCVINCAASSIVSSGSNCTSIQDPCICNDTQFQNAMTDCLKDCTTAEQLAAKALEKGICGIVPSTSNTTSNGALAVQIDFAQSTIFALTVAVASAVMGGLLI